MTGANAEAIRKRLDALAGQSWSPHFTIHGDPMVVPVGTPWPSHRIADMSVSPDDYGRANTEFTAHAPDDVRALLADLDAVWAVVREYLPDAVGHNSLPEIVEGIARQRDAQHEFKDHLAETAQKLTAQRDALRADCAGCVGWGITCRSCARTLDAAYVDTMRAEKAEAERDDLRRRVSEIRALCVDAELVICADEDLADPVAPPTLGIAVSDIERVLG